ncbi:hypothetical protein COLO4_21294 [Corchorus olitorius]|uniref:Uncharacterized protein n=1 Tax=Corchorus olitorius TaxID=93759 RepID=A0A1R3IUA4_9ROSI|nr:hypothetical protein COLO4_21294 [Corchorus olitorius]
MCTCGRSIACFALALINLLVKLLDLLLPLLDCTLRIELLP